MKKSKLKFNEEKHQYILKYEGGEKQLISVTALLRKHNLSPNYAGIAPEILKAKAERGTVIHEELEEYINNGEIGFTSELEEFIKLCQTENIEPQKSEIMVHNDEIAGTIDIVGNINGVRFLGDFKTTVTLHTEAVAWQLSLYAYLSNEKFDKLLCIHFPNAEICKVVEIKPISTEEIEKLLECERNGEIYEGRKLELDIIDCQKILTIQQELKGLDERKKELEKVESELKQMLIARMEENGVKSVDNDYFKITYVESSLRESIDTGKLKKELPEIAEAYIKQTPVKASVRITLKN